MRSLTGCIASLMALAGMALSVGAGISWLALLLKIRARLAETEKQLTKLEESRDVRES